MSTISIFNTAEGFALASDGRSSDTDGRTLTEDAQKIFPIGGLGTHLAYARAGTIRIGDATDRVLFDFDIATANVSRDCVPSGNWFEYLNAMATSLTNQLNDVRSTSVCSLNEPLETWLFVCGFYGRNWKCAHVIFRHAANSTEATPYLHPPGFNHPFGSGKVLELVDSGDRRFRQYSEPPRNRIVTLAQAIERTRNDVRAQCDPEAMTVDELTCRGIGGRIQMATITTSHGFRWVTGFEPASPSTASR
jgi:hypothetical protein